MIHIQKTGKTARNTCLVQYTMQMRPFNTNIRNETAGLFDGCQLVLFVISPVGILCDRKLHKLLCLFCGILVIYMYALLDSGILII